GLGGLGLELLFRLEDGACVFDYYFFFQTPSLYHLPFLVCAPPAPVLTPPFCSFALRSATAARVGRQWWLRGRRALRGSAPCALPSYHDLMDPDGGYARAAQTEFFDLAVRDYGTGIGPRLEDLRLVNIVSISPRNEFFRSLSWKIDAGWARRRLAGGDEPLVFG